MFKRLVQVCLPVRPRQFSPGLAVWSAAAVLCVGGSQPALAQSPAITATAWSDPTVVVIGRGLAGTTALSVGDVAAFDLFVNGDGTMVTGRLAAAPEPGSYVVRLAATITPTFSCQSSRPAPDWACTATGGWVPPDHPLAVGFSSSTTSLTFVLTVGSSGAVGPPGPHGSQGLPGPAGPQGSQGATGPAGPEGPPVSFQGTWSGATSYATGDAVFYQGSSYISLASGNVNNTPSGGAPSALLAQQGNTGAQGAQGPQGLVGPAGPTGATGPTGPAGPAGPAGSGNLFATALLNSFAPRYFPVFGNGSNGTESVVANRFPVACTVANLTVTVVDGATGYPYVPVTQVSMTAGLRINAANALTCTTSATSSCSSAGPVTINAGDLVNFFATGQDNLPSAVIKFSASCQ